MSGFPAGRQTITDMEEPVTPGNKGLGSLEAKSCDKEKNREAEG